MSRSKSAKKQKQKIATKSTAAPKPARPKATLQIESLEPRILLSATWTGTNAADTFDSGNGDDVLDGGAGNDQLYGGNHDDTLFGGSGDDVLFGGNQADTLHGGTGDDQLFGDNQEDVLISGGGNDVMHGGHHNDTFRFDGAQHEDVITVDGGMHNDTIDLSGYSNDQIEDDGSTLVVHMSETTHFTVNYSNVESITTADGSYQPGEIPDQWEAPPIAAEQPPVVDEVSPADEPPTVQDEADQPGAGDGEQPPLVDEVTPPADEPPLVQDEVEQPGAGDGEQPPVEDAVNPPADEPPLVQDEVDQPGAGDGEQPPVVDEVSPAADEPPTVQDEADQPGAGDGEQPPVVDEVTPPADEPPPVQDEVEQPGVGSLDDQTMSESAEMPVPEEHSDAGLSDHGLPGSNRANTPGQSGTHHSATSADSSTENTNPGSGQVQPGGDHSGHDWTGNEDLQVMDPSGAFDQTSVDDQDFAAADQEVVTDEVAGDDDEGFSPFVAQSSSSGPTQPDDGSYVAEFNFDRVVGLPEFAAPAFPTDLLPELSATSAEAVFHAAEEVSLDLSFPLSMVDSTAGPGAQGSVIAERNSAGLHAAAGWTDGEARRRSGNEQEEAVEAAMAHDSQSQAAESAAGYVVASSSVTGEGVGFFARLWSAVRGLGATGRQEGERDSSRTGVR